MEVGVMLQIKRDRYPRIGLFAIGLETYWEQFPQIRPYLEKTYQTLSARLAGKCELVSVGIVDTVERAQEAGRMFKARDVDLVFCSCATYSPSSNMMPALRDLNVPVVVLNVQPEPKLALDSYEGFGDWLKDLTCAGAGEATAMLLRYGIPFSTVTGWLNNDEVAEREIDNWCKAAKIRRTLREGKAALLGHPFNGMMDLNVNETNIHRQIGLYSDYLELHEIKDAMENVTHEEQAELGRYIQEKYILSDGLTQEDFEYTAKACAAMIRLIRERNYIMVPMHFSGKTDDEYGPIVSVMNLVFSILITNGIPCTVECDLKTAIAMLILKELCGSCNMGELYGMDFPANTVLIGHSGASDLSLSDSKPMLKVSSVFHGKSGKGVMTQFAVKKGPVTMISLVEDNDGQYTILAAEGEAVEGPVLTLGDTNACVRFGGDIRSFVDRWLRRGPSHHGAFAIGKCADQVEKVASVLGMQFIQI